MTIVIPEQLKNSAFRFIRIAMDGPSARKRPLETDWQNTNNYPIYSYPLDVWLSEGNNYGVVCGYGNLAVIDADDKAISFLVENRLPKTFTVQTGSGGKHYYYIIPDLEKKFVLQRLERNEDVEWIKHYGEIQWKGSQVVGPNSIHPSGNKYLVFADYPIATITNQHILEIFGDYIKQEQPPKPYSGDNNYQWVDIGLILARYSNDALHYKQKGGEFVGKHPVHGSSTGGNFSVNRDKGIWHCFRCGTGGGPISLIAMLEGLIQCGDSRPGAVTNEIYQKVLKISKEKYGVEIKDA